MKRVNGHQGSLKGKAYETIKQKIIEGVISGGMPISEKELIEELGISRTPIREALNKLEEEHLLEIFPKRGVFVTRISSEDIDDIYSLRIILEPYAARCAAPQLDPDRLERYREFWSDADVAYHSTDHVHHDQELHSAIAEATRNKYLIQFLSRLYDQANRIRFLSLVRAKDRQAQIKQEHLAIIERLIEQDADGAEAAMRDHLVRAKETALRVYG